MNKIGFYLMTQKGYIVLTNYLNEFSSETIENVVIGRDSNVLNDYSAEIFDLCKRTNIPCTFTTDNYSFSCDYILTISWRWLIKQKSKKIIILHDSLLPSYRGFAPLVTSLIKGEDRIGVTALFASDYYDAGPIIMQKSMDIHYPLKIADAIALISEIYSKIVNEITHKIISNNILLSTPQDEKKVTYSLWLDEEDYRINWNCDSDYIIRFVDAVGLPYKGAFSILENKKIRIIECIEETDVQIEYRTPGKVLFIRNDRPVVVCGRGLIKIITAHYDSNNESIFPLPKFRNRFL
jgi:methionyl-tRNA formyltransferase